ncbi:MAG: hypothetical protein M1838_004147 [Thelocarpon superellum]|nr:MAG: hypothetical protein M1838_004147 [Thelocarpon superellum]
MTAVAPPPSFPPLPRSTWSAANGSESGLNAMSTEDVSRMFMPRKSVPRNNSSSSLASTSSTATITNPAPQPNGVLPPVAGTDLTGRAGRKKPTRGLWASSKTDPATSMAPVRSHAVATAGSATATAMSPLHNPSPILPSQHMLQGGQATNGVRANGTVSHGENNAVLSLLPMNGTFERKTIGVPLFPDVLRIGRQTNAKTLPTPMNGFFDSKVLSRQHAEIWSDRQGKIWIRDVKSSNGTFVNGKRLSGENRDSEPHELHESDTLELGIDIVSEDQKTVVHHKVAAKVEHAGFLPNNPNVLDLNFGDIDSPSYPQSPSQTRGRSGSAGSVGSAGRLSNTASVAGSNMIGGGPSKHTNFWLTPVTMEQIVNRLSSELRQARQQSLDLQRTGDFFDALLTHGGLPEEEAGPAPEPANSPQANGDAVVPSQRARFSDPPAPPPQQPLPEKPDSVRGQPLESPPQPVLKRTDTERPLTHTRASPSPLMADSPTQILSLMDALGSARDELKSQSVRLQSLEDLLQEERTARAAAEARCEQLQKEKEILAGDGGDRYAVLDAYAALQKAKDDEGRADGAAVDDGSDKEAPKPASPAKATEVEQAEESAARLQQRLDLMMTEMREMSSVVERYKRRAEAAEEESALTRKTLAEMVEKIRRDDVERSSATRRYPHAHGDHGSTDSGVTKLSLRTVVPEDGAGENGLPNGKSLTPVEVAALEHAVTAALAQSRRRQDQLLQSAPYASILGVVILGMGVMAFLNGWQKVDR